MTAPDRENSSENFKGAFVFVLKRNLVRLAILVVLGAIALVISIFRTHVRSYVTPHSLAKTTLQSVSLPEFLKLDLPDSRGSEGKKFIEAKIAGLSSEGMSPVAQQICVSEIKAQLKDRAVWIRALNVDDAWVTTGKILLPPSNPNPGNQAAPEDVALWVLQKGCAYFCENAAKDLSAQERADYQAAEKHAQSERAGLWGNEQSAQKPPAHCISAG